MKAGIHFRLGESWREHWSDVSWYCSNAAPHWGTALYVCYSRLYHTLWATLVPDSLWWTIKDMEHVKFWLHLSMCDLSEGGLEDFILMVAPDARLGVKLPLKEMRHFQFPRTFQRLPPTIVFISIFSHLWVTYAECFFLLMPSVYFFKMAQMPASVGPTGLPTVELGLDDGQAPTAVRPPVCIVMHTRRTYINDFAQAEQVIFRDLEIYTNHDGSHCDVHRQHI